MSHRFSNTDSSSGPSSAKASWDILIQTLHCLGTCSCETTVKATTKHWFWMNTTILPPLHKVDWRRYEHIAGIRNITHIAEPVWCSCVCSYLLICSVDESCLKPGHWSHISGKSGSISEAKLSLGAAEIWLFYSVSSTTGLSKSGVGKIFVMTYRCIGYTVSLATREPKSLMLSRSLNKGCFIFSAAYSWFFSMARGTSVTGSNSCHILHKLTMGNGYSYTSCRLVTPKENLLLKWEWKTKTCLHFFFSFFFLNDQNDRINIALHKKYVVIMLL